MVHGLSLGSAITLALYESLLDGIGSVQPDQLYMAGTLPVYHQWLVLSVSILEFLLFHFMEYFFKLNNDNNGIRT